MEISKTGSTCWKCFTMLEIYCASKKKKKKTRPIYLTKRRKKKYIPKKYKHNRTVLFVLPSSIVSLKQIYRSKKRRGRRYCNKIKRNKQKEKGTVTEWKSYREGTVGSLFNNMRCASGEDEKKSAATELARRERRAKEEGVASRCVGRKLTRWVDRRTKQPVNGWKTKQSVSRKIVRLRIERSER